MSQKNEWADLHSHSNRSDGTLSPTDLIKLAAKRKIGTFALTDHDTVAGIEEAAKEAQKQGIRLIPGIEISAIYPAGTLHILGYGIDYNSPKLHEKLSSFQDARNHRNDQIIQKLQELGIPIELEEVRARAIGAKTLGRPHIAATLISKGIVLDIKECFDRYLGTTGKAYVDKEIFSAQETIEMIHRAGGKAFVAHPIHLKLELSDTQRYIQELKEQGLDGIEVYTSAHDRSTSRKYRELAESLELLISGGSDYHGTHKSRAKLGQCHEQSRIRKEWLSDFFFEEQAAVA